MERRALAASNSGPGSRLAYLVEHAPEGAVRWHPTHAHERQKKNKSVQLADRVREKSSTLALSVLLRPLLAGVLVPSAPWGTAGASL